MPLPVIAQIAIGVGLAIVGYLLAPRPKPPKPPSLEDLENPTQEAGRPIPVTFGSMSVKGLNILWYGDKSISTREVSTGK